MKDNLLSTHLLGGWAIAAAILVFGAKASVGAPEFVLSDNSIGGVVGVCILIGTDGKVKDAVLATTSGDKLLDKSVIDYAQALHWDMPYPRPGWMGINVGVGVSKAGKSLPTCPLPSAKGKPTS